MEWTMEDAYTTTENTPRPIVPVGTWDFEIKNASEGPNQYRKSDKNPEGMCLSFRLSALNGSYLFVYVDIPQHISWIANQLGDAIGFSERGGMVKMDPIDIEGVRVRCEIEHYTNPSTGKTSAQVKRYLPAVEAVEPVAEQKAPAARSQTAKARAAMANDDDIPF